MALVGQNAAPQMSTLHRCHPNPLATFLHPSFLPPSTPSSLPPSLFLSSLLSIFPFLVAFDCLLLFDFVAGVVSSPSRSATALGLSP